MFDGYSDRMVSSYTVIPHMQETFQNCSLKMYQTSPLIGYFLHFFCHLRASRHFLSLFSDSAGARAAQPASCYFPPGPEGTEKVQKIPDRGRCLVHF